jgi:hypothetical protein
MNFLELSNTWPIGLCLHLFRWLGTPFSFNLLELPSTHRAVFIIITQPPLNAVGMVLMAALAPGGRTGLSGNLATLTAHIKRLITNCALII